MGEIMKEQDYLWDKTGSDPEIERLEQALMMFRSKETAPPALPAKVLPFPEKIPGKIAEKTPRFRFSFAFAFAACAAIVLITFAVFFQLSNSKTAMSVDSAKTVEPETNSETKNDSINTNRANVSSIEKAEIPKQVEAPKQITKQIVQETAKQNVVKKHENILAKSRPNKTIAENAAVKTPAVTLTAEEQNAYDQLMLALSITSSKLNIVKDKIERAEEQNATDENGR